MTRPTSAEALLSCGERTSARLMSLQGSGVDIDTSNNSTGVIGAWYDRPLSSKSGSDEESECSEFILCSLKGNLAVAAVNEADD